MEESSSIPSRNASKKIIKIFRKIIDVQKKGDIIVFVIVITRQSRTSKYRQDWSIREDDRHQLVVAITSPADFLKGQENASRRSGS